MAEIKNFLDYPDAENCLAYQYAKNFLDHPQHAESLKRSLKETIVSGYKTSDSQAPFPSYLIADSRETSGAWDALHLIAQAWIREGKPLPPEAAQWVADVLADHWEKRKKGKRRPRPTKGAHRWFNRNLLFCVLVDMLIHLFDFAPTRQTEEPPLSACDVVAAATTKSAAIARPLTHKTVGGIWTENRDEILKGLSGNWNQEALLKKFLS